MNVFSHHVHAEAEFAATAEEVWSVLADLDSYPEWDPQMERYEGELRVGARVRETLRVDGNRTITFKPVLLTVEPGRELTGRGRLLAPGVFTGVHRYRIESLGDGRVKVSKCERLTGLLVPMMRRRLTAEVQPKFETAIAALGERVRSLRESSERRS